MFYYQATQDNKKLSKKIYSIKGELFTQREVRRYGLDTTFLALVNIPKSHVYFSFGVRLPYHG